MKLNDMAVFHDPPPTPEERACAFVDVICRRLPRREDVATPEAARRTILLRREVILKLAPKTWLELRREDFATPEAANHALWLRGEVIAAFLSGTPLGKCTADFHNAIRRRDLPAARQLQAELKDVALATRPDWDWGPAFDLHARTVDALAEGRTPDEEVPADINLLAALWMGDSPNIGDLLTGLRYNLWALGLTERKVAGDVLGEALDEVLRDALYVAKGDVDLRTEPFPQVGRKVRGRQRREALAELPLAEQDRAKPKAQRKLGFEPYNPAVPDPLLREHSTTSSVLRERLSAALPPRRPAERRAVLEALEAARQGVPLPRYWGDAYQRKIKALQRASKRIKGMGSGS